MTNHYMNNNVSLNNIFNGEFFYLGEESDVKFRLKCRDKEDNFWFITQFTLDMLLSDTDIPYRIAYIRVMFLGQDPGEIPSSWDKIISFISTVWSAERLFLFLSPSQRLRLEEILSIRYDCKDIENEPVFELSILEGRGKTKKVFIKEQERIKRLMRSKIDVSSVLLQNKDELSMFLYDDNRKRSDYSRFGIYED
ncbi:MAG: hypothetical protein K2M17_00270 [Bacilli bacterium]|nr:hypothetical protein [Bacilli bacterium]